MRENGGARANAKSSNLRAVSAPLDPPQPPGTLEKGLISQCLGNFRNRSERPIGFRPSSSTSRRHSSS